MSLETKINFLQEQIEKYKTLSDLDKLDKNNEITKLIKECEMEINEYKMLVETPIIDVKNTNNEINNITGNTVELTQEEYSEILEQINISQQLLKTSNCDDLDSFTQTYFELNNNIKKCKQYLESKKMTINQI